MAANFPQTQHIGFLYNNATAINILKCFKQSFSNIPKPFDSEINHNMIFKFENSLNRMNYFSKITFSQLHTMNQPKQTNFYCYT